MVYITSTPSVLDQSNAEFDDFTVEWVKMVLLLLMPTMLGQSNAELDSFRAEIDRSNAERQLS